MADQYGWHHVEREDLNEGWIWIWNQQDKDRDRIENRRPVLLLKINKTVCCETLYADDRFLINRRYPVLIGAVADFEEKRFKVRDQMVDFTDAKFRGGTAADLANGKHVCVYGKRTEADEVHAEKVILDFKENLIFLSAWYRYHLGIAKEISPMTVEFPDNQLQAMWWQLRACARHPQIAVVMSTVLAVVGTGLGIIGAAAILEAVLKDRGWISWIWLPVALVGGMVFILAFAPLYSRARNYLRAERT